MAMLGCRAVAVFEPVNQHAGCFHVEVLGISNVEVRKHRGHVAALSFAYCKNRPALCGACIDAAVVAIGGRQAVAAVNGVVARLCNTRRWNLGLSVQSPWLRRGGTVASGLTQCDLFIDRSRQKTVQFLYALSDRVR